MIKDQVRGQIGLETILSIIVVLLIFTIAFLYFSHQNQLTVALENLYKNKSNCTYIASQISYAYSTGKKFVSFIYIESDFNVHRNYIELSDTICYFQGVANEARLHRGFVKIESYNGVVNVENV